MKNKNKGKLLILWLELLILTFGTLVLALGVITETPVAVMLGFSISAIAFIVTKVIEKVI